VGAERTWAPKEMEVAHQMETKRAVLFLVPPPVQFPQDVKSHAHFYIQSFEVKKIVI
jgi:hypothetical protein